MTLELRAAQTPDGPALVDIEQQSFTNPHWDLDSFFQYDCSVAVVEKAVVGFCVTREIGPAIAEEPAEREILNIAVHAHFRRRGIATSLLTNELNRSATHFLEVRESNYTARRLYEKLGFRAVATRKQYYENPSEAAVVMTLKRW